jgi:hypothetical protein
MTRAKGYHTKLTRAQLETALECHTELARMWRVYAAQNSSPRPDVAALSSERAAEEEGKANTLRWILKGDV